MAQQAQYDDILRLPVPWEASIISFADYIPVVVVAKLLEEVELFCNETVRMIKCWFRGTELQLANHKTEVLQVSSRKAHETMTLRVGEYCVASQPSIKYLFVMIDARLTYKLHSEYGCEKSSRAVRSLSSLMSNVGGPRQNKRLLLVRAASSVQLYGAQVWANAAKVKSYGHEIKSV